ncbi:hypothetical protein D9619_001685 [Psilocybe cf. subviscida]|uniref:Phytocyanin domain-containing protein n=1 Tax=Psilocybe cf. subviscida TaxID=2480587 RepID=A0A8H5BDC5_9AGAR|nr:hypothetical protein D9619_001685 [Psilocybe cf. subviscida]
MPFIAAACAKTIVITVGGNTTINPMGVFDPPQVNARIGDVVVFNFTQGNHTATQSTFASPCIPAHFTNETINGFDSSFRDTHNGTATTQLSVPIQNNDTIWFFDWNTCAVGGVGGINLNSSSDSTETLDGFQRNALRLNGTDSDTSASSSAQVVATSPTATNPAASPSQTTSAATRVVVQGAFAAALPAALALVALAF